MTNSNQNIQDKVYSCLRKSILNLSLIPGTVISTQDIATKLKVSRTPAREALIRLQKDNLVQVLPQRETMVSLLNMNRARQERFIRINLEQAVITEFLKKANSSHFQKLNTLIAQQLEASVNQQHETLLQYDDAFHATLFEGADQALAWELINQNSTHYQRIRLLSLMVDDISEKIIIQHQEMLRALEDHALDQVLSIHKKHLSKLDFEENQLREQYHDYFLNEEENNFLDFTF